MRTPHDRESSQPLLKESRVEPCLVLEAELADGDVPTFRVPTLKPIVVGNGVESRHLSPVRLDELLGPPQDRPPETLSDPVGLDHQQVDVAGLLAVDGLAPDLRVGPQDRHGGGDAAMSTKNEDPTVVDPRRHAVVPELARKPLPDPPRQQPVGDAVTQLHDRGGIARLGRFHRDSVEGHGSPPLGMAGRHRIRAPRQDRAPREYAPSPRRAFNAVIAHEDGDTGCPTIGSQPVPQENGRRESRMSTDGPLDTPEKIDAVMAAMAASMPGWVPPAAYGLTLVPMDALGRTSVRFPVVNVGAHAFPALALAEVTGRRSETATYELSAEQLGHAVDIVAPAEAATMYQHPNLESWRRVLEDLSAAPGGRIFAVFISSLDDPVSSPYDEALRKQIVDGDRSSLV